MRQYIYIYTHAVGGVPCAFSPHPRFTFLKWTIAPSQTFSPPKYFLGLTNILTAHKNFHGGKLKAWYKRTNNIRLFSPYLVQLYYPTITSRSISHFIPLCTIMPHCIQLCYIKLYCIQTQYFDITAVLYARGTVPLKSGYLLPCAKIHKKLNTLKNF